MGDKSAIQWTEATWNPTTGCDRVSPGCDHCYAMTLAKRLKAMGQPRYQVDGDPRTSGPGFGVQAHATALDQPLRWKRPRRIFVNSMSDLFHDSVSTTFIAAVFDVMARCPQHTFQILTKRHARMRSLSKTAAFGEHWPLPNVWLGVSAEDQHWADIRIPALMQTRAAVRFVSAEPLIGPVRLHRGHGHCPVHDFAGGFCMSPCPDLVTPDWLIVGGESGPGSRPMDPEWARSLIRDCSAAGTAPFVKQLGAVWAREHGADSHGGDWSFWPEDLRIREFPAAAVTAGAA